MAKQPTVVHLDEVQDASRVLDHIVDTLKKGGVILAPTETVYGLMTLWDNDEGRERIRRMKQRDANKPLQMLALDLQSAVDNGVTSSPKLQAVSDAFWPGSLTVVVPARDGETIGVRIPAGELARELLVRLDRPLAASSANASGQPTADTASDAVATLVESPDMVVDTGRPMSSKASTVLSLLDYDPEILRPGAVRLEQVVEVLRQQGLRR